MRIFRNPVSRVSSVLFFDIFPTKTLPTAKVDLTQCRSHMAGDPKSFGDCQSSLVGPAQVAGVNQPWILSPKLFDESRKLNTTTRIQFRIGLAAKGSRHVCLRMSYEEYLAHAIHAPQK